jgi:adenylate kinase family enzyme
MRRIVIVGCAGSGKSTLARQLGERLGLPILHLDTLFWLPEWREPASAEYRARFAAAFAGEDWVSDGNFFETLEQRLPRADALIILDRSRWLCLFRVLWRACFQRYERPDLPAGCPEGLDWKLLRYVWRYNAVSRPALEAARLAFGRDVPTIRLRNDREVIAFLKTMPRSRPSRDP